MQKRFFWLGGVGVLLTLAFLPASALAAPAINSATLGGGSGVTVLPSASISAAVTATGSGGSSKWRSTGWAIATSAPGSFTCVNTPNHDSSQATETFNITAPSSTGTYNAYFKVFSDDTCNNDPSSLLTLTSGVIVVAPDLTATKTNNLGGANAAANETFTWQIRVRNIGNATATFANNEELLKDEMPDTNVGNYNSPTLVTSGTTGTIVCTTTGGGAVHPDLKCKASGTVTMPVDSFFDVFVDVLPTSVGSLVNPRSGKKCQADSGTNVAESDETNNNCSQTVTVSAKPTLTVNKVIVPANDNGLFNLRIDGATAGTGANQGNGGTTGAVTVNTGQRTVSETAGTGTSLSDYTSVISGDCAADGSITLTAGQTKTCTITNTKKPKLTIIKVTDPTGDTGKFNLSINGTQYATDVSNTGTTGAQFGTIGANTFAEAAGTGTSLSDYTSVVSGAGCGGTATAGTITLAAGDNKTCTITNTKKGTAIVKKVMVGGTDTFNFTGTPSGAISVDGGTISSQVVPGQYVSTETVPAGWDLTSVACDDGGDSVGSVPNKNATFNVAAGEIVTCTFTNTKRGHIIVVKDAVPNDAQDFSFTNDFANGNPSPFSLDDDADGTLSNTRDSEVLPGTYSVSEGAVAGWDPTSATCSDGSPVSAIVVSAGETVTCTFTNTKRGEIHGMKFEDLNGNGVKNQGEPGLAGWTISLFDGNATTTTVTMADDPNTLNTDETGMYWFTDLPVGTYTVSEISQNGWTQTTANPAPIPINPGDVVNDVDFGNFHEVTITGLKWDDSNGDGIRQGGEPVQSGVTVEIRRVKPGHYPVQNIPIDTELVQLSLTGGGGIFTGTVPTPGRHVVVEQVPAGSQQTAPAGNSFFDVFVELSGQPINTGTLPGCQPLPVVGVCQPVPLEFGNFKLITVRVQKDVLDPNEGPATDPHPFKVTLDGLGEQSIIEAGSEAVYGGVGPGPHTLAENLIGDPDFDLLRISHNGQTLNGGIFLPQSGQDMTIVVTNKQKKAKITVVKVLPNNNGSTATPDQFSFKVDGGTPIPFEVDGSNDVLVNPGAHSVAEVAATGYTTGLTNSQNPNLDCAGLVLGSNGSATCTITNDDIAPTLTVIKTLVPANDPGKFNLQIDGQTAGTGANVGDTGTTGAVAVNAGTRTVGEAAGTNTVLSDYNTVIGGGCNPNGTITLQPGDNKTCTITNTRKTGKIKIVKIAQGGDDTFGFTITGPTGSTPSFATSGGNGNTGEITVNTGAYSATETTVPAGWDLTGAICDTGTPQSFNVAEDQTVVCTFTNTKKGSITVKKVMVGGTDTFNFTGNPAGAISTNNGTLTATVVPGSYTSTEAVAAGWDLTNITCVDPSNDSSGVIGTGVATFNVAAGESVTCTFTNVKRGHIIVKKTTNPANDPTVFEITASSSTGGSITGGGVGTVTDATDQDYEVTPGTYSVAETPPGEWNMVDNTCENIVVGAGETKTCTIINSKQATLKVKKVLVPAQDPGLFNLQIDGATQGTGANVGNGGTTGAVVVSSGNHTVGETAGTGTNLADYTSVISGDCSPNGQVNLASGENKVCTITNTRNTGTITFVKEVVGGTAQASQWTFDVSGGPQGILSGGQATLNTGSYTVTENGPAGYALTAASGACSLNGNVITLTVTTQGGTCVITNTFQKKDSHTTTEVHKPPHIHITNQTVPAGTQVHDQAIVAGDGVVAPTGQVTFDRYSNSFCGGQPIATEIVALSLVGVNGEAESTPVTPAPGSHGYKASYGGDAVYLPSQGICEPFTVEQQEPTGEIHGVKFEDLNGNGRKDANEPVLPGWTIYLDISHDHVLTGGDLSTVTNALGEYWFMNLPDGTYHVREVAQVGWLQTLPVNPNEYVVVIAGGNVVIGKDFGNFKLGSIHGIKYEDKNGNGKKDIGEPVLSGWTISLTKPDGSVVTAVTDADGKYWFMDLGPGKYKLDEEKRKGWKQTSKNPKPIDIKSGTVNEGNDFGNQGKK